MVFERLKRELDRTVDSGSVVAFRIGFGAVMLFAVIRFVARGWVRSDFLVPTHFFHYAGLGWVHPLPGVGMYVVYGVMGLSAIGIACGLGYRLACIGFFLCFTYAHACDKSNYLNHYYLVSLLAGLMTFLPLARDTGRVRAWALWLVRFQVGVVYVFGGLGKLGSDWLVYGEPLRIWLRAKSELPVIGLFAHSHGFAIAFSWAGMLFDLGVVPALLWRPTRVPAYLALIVFHVLTSVLFNIGMFPWIMIAAATVFFDPAWPRRWRRAGRDAVAGRSLSTISLAMVGLYALFQLTFPLRSHLYPGNTLWNEEGFRFSWKVMLIEKSAELELTVVDAANRRTTVSPREYLTPFQARMASTQPDMILELAHMVADDYSARGRGPVRVFAESEVSFNGRLRAPLIDPTVNLAAIGEDLWPYRFVLPAPRGAPEF